MNKWKIPDVKKHIIFPYHGSTKAKQLIIVWDTYYNNPITLHKMFFTDIGGVHKLNKNPFKEQLRKLHMSESEHYNSIFMEILDHCW